MKNEFSIIHLHSSTDDYYLTSKSIGDFFEMAYSYYYNLREKTGRNTLENQASHFGEHRQIDSLEFNILCNAANREETIKMVVNLDFENDTVGLWSRDTPIWKSYTLPEIESAIEKSTVGKHYTVETQKELFMAYLEGNEIVVPKLGNNEKYWGKGEFIKSCFKELMSDGKAHNYSEIAGYISKKAERMNIQDEIKATSFAVIINRLVQSKNSQYMRVARGYYKLKTAEMVPKENSSTQDKLVISKADFIRNCFKELLNDGQRHSFNEILEYINRKSEMTSFEEYFDSAIVLNGLKMILKKDNPEYVKVGHAVYQKVSSDENIVCETDIEENKLQAVLDKTNALKNQAKKLCDEYCEIVPQRVYDISTTFINIDENLKQCMKYLNDMTQSDETAFEEDSFVPTLKMDF